MHPYYQDYLYYVPLVESILKSQLPNCSSRCTATRAASSPSEDRRYLTKYGYSGLSRSFQRHRFDFPPVEGLSAEGQRSGAVQYRSFG
jgi:hypothetical protein